VRVCIVRVSILGGHHRAYLGEGALTPALSHRRGSQSPVPLLLGEKGLGDEGLQFNYTYLLNSVASFVNLLAVLALVELAFPGRGEQSLWRRLR
jgi:hypothetical protein